MSLRLPLYVKILLWFFLNLVGLAAVLGSIFFVQFNWDWLLAAGARDRIDAVGDLIVGELNVADPDDWAAVLRRYSAAHRVEFGLLDEQGRLLVGDVGAVPEDARARVTNYVRENRGALVPAVESEVGMPEFFGKRTPNRGLRAIVRSGDPAQYWLLASTEIDNLLAGGPLWVVLVARSQSISAGGLIINPKPWLALGCGAVVFSLLLWLPLVRSITGAVARMTQATRQIADGRFDVRIAEPRRDELGALGEAIDQMAGRLDGYVKGQKRFLGDIAHELCSPLARLQMALGVLEQRVSKEHAAAVRSASEKAEQIAALVAELLTFSKASFGPSAVRLEPVLLSELLDAAVRRECPSDGAQVRQMVREDCRVMADRELLVRALANLLRNALRHAGVSGPIFLEARSDGPEAVITVADSGPGVPDAELPKIFDAFYRVDTARMRETGGIGLGLAIVKSSVDACGGTVSARNRAPHGLEVTLRIPRSASDCVPRDPA
jgi:two-component system, OmpR family, sensor histidine kinase CpxA